MAGRPRKVVDISTGKIGKKKIVNRQEQEKKIKLPRDRLESEIPEWLNETAKAEFLRIVTDAGEIDLLDNLDLPTLAIYADSYSRYIECAKAMAKDGIVIEDEEGNQKISPFVSIADKAATQIQKCSTKLGLATTDRLKLIVPTKEEVKKNKFDAYF